MDMRGIRKLIMRNDYYCYLCKDCEYLFHCFGREKGIEIIEDKTDMYLCPDACIDYYPEKKQ